MVCQRKIKFYLEEEYKSSKVSILKKYNKTRYESKSDQTTKKINKRGEREQSHNTIKLQLYNITPEFKIYQVGMSSGNYSWHVQENRIHTLKNMA